MAAVDRNALLAHVERLLEPHKGRRQLDVFPDSAAEFQAKYLKSQAGAWLLGYAGGRKLRGGEGARARSFAVDVTVLSRRLSGDGGALDDVATIEGAVDGQRFALGDVGYVVEATTDSFLGEEDQVWKYTVRLVCTTL